MSLLRLGLMLTLLLGIAAPIGAEEKYKLSKVQALHRHAESMIAQDNFRGAIHSYQESLFIEPDDESAYVNMGSCYMILGDFENAKRSYEYALTINPENWDAQRGLDKIRDPDSTRIEF